MTKQEFDAALNTVMVLAEVVYSADEFQAALEKRGLRIVPAERGDYWIWMGDAEDHLESMSDGMLVLIRADQLRAISGMTLSRRAFLDAMFSIDSSTMTFGDARALLRAVGVTVTP